MRIAILIFDKLTALDAIGPYEVLSRLPGAELSFVAKQRGVKRADTDRLGINADVAISELPDPDLVLVPGGEGNRPLLADEEVLDWLRGAHEGSTWTTSVCTGSLLLAAAGLLDGTPATTHWLARDLLAGLGAEPVPDRVVEHGKIITGAGVSSGIDMALRLVQLMHGDEAAQAVQLGIEYDPQPPVDAGSPEKAPKPIVELVTTAFEAQS
jgi:transcriptional regulator GlxA family with amidase domain